MSKTAKKIILYIVIAITFVGTFFSGYYLRYFLMDSEMRAVYDILNKYKKYYYYDDGDLEREISHAILDKYSTYYTKEEYSEIKNSRMGNTSGIGITFNNKTLQIVEVSGNSPAEKAGVRRGGYLRAVKVYQDFIEIKNGEQLSDVLSGIPNNIEFTISVEYSYESNMLYTLKKQNYKQTFVHYYDNLGFYGYSDKSGEFELEKLDTLSMVSSDDSDTAVIDYDSFYGTESGVKGSYGQIEGFLNKFKEDNKKNLIIDLRDNGGGYMDILCDISSFFVDVERGERADVAVAVDKYDNKLTYKSKPSKYSDYNYQNIIILANEYSASASEAFIGAVLDYDKNNIVKVLVASSIVDDKIVYKTYGKGIMQSTYLNADGSAIKLTVAEIFWPVSNTCIHYKGIIGKSEGKILGVDKNEVYNKAFELLK